MNNQLSQGDRAFKYVSLLPLLVLLLVLAMLPLAGLAKMSLSDVRIVSGRQTMSFVGLKNYREVLHDPVFLQSFRNTLVYVFFSVVIEVSLGLFLSLKINSLKKMTIFYRTVLLIPFLIPPVVNGTMWKLILNPQFGLLNKGLTALGLPPQSILSDERFALAGIMIVTVWQWVGYNMLILYAGLQTIPDSIIEAAQIDGCGRTGMLFKIIIPLIMPILFIALVFRMIHAFKGFDLFYVLTGGGPGNATEIINTYTQKVFMTQQRMGYGSALSLITIFVILVLFFVLQYVVNRRSDAS